MTPGLAEFEPLWPAEQTLFDQLHSGEIIRISDSVPPPDAPKEHRLRASFLRFVLLAREDGLRPGAKGLLLSGAFIDGDLAHRSETAGLDLEGCGLDFDLALTECRIPDLLLLRGARLTDLFLTGSVLSQGISADRLETRGDVVLRDARVSGEVRLPGAKLGADLDCDGATLQSEGTDFALFADGLIAGGDVFLRQAKVTGGVRLPGAKIGGNLECDGLELLPGSTGDALVADGMAVAGGLFLRDGADIRGTVRLNAASAGFLVDELGSWPKGAGQLVLDGFRYDRITSGPVTARARLKWLEKQDPSKFDEVFWPQPYEQLANVLREMGHREAARTVLIEKERLQRAAARRRSLWRPLLWLRDLLIRSTVAYGHRPLQAILWLAVFWGLGAAVFWYTEQQGALKPNQPVFLHADEWTGCYQPDFAKRIGLGQTQYECFLSRPEAQSYPRFNPWIYAADTLLPVVDLEMQSYWIPDERHAFGQQARWYLWFQIAVGWALSLLAVAGFSGLIKSD